MRRAAKELRTGMEKLHTRMVIDAFVCILQDYGKSQLLQNAWLASQKYQGEQEDGL